MVSPETEMRMEGAVTAPQRQSDITLEYNKQDFNNVLRTVTILKTTYTILFEVLIKIFM